jgi:hypothetical protein
MIRKPSEEDFREGDAVRALRETHKITVEGSKGIGAGLGKMYLTYLSVTVALGLGLTLAVATSGLALIPMVVGGIWLWRWRRGNEAARAAALKAEHDRIVREVSRGRAGSAATDRLPDDGDVAFPAEVRRRGAIEADIGAVARRAFMLLMLAFILLFVFGIATGMVGLVLGTLALMLAVLIGSRAFGHRKLIEWDTRKVKVWHLLSEAEMQWSDVTDVTVEKASRFNLAVYFQSGSRRNIVITALHNHLGGPNTLRVPLRYMNLPRTELEKLLRDLFCWRAAGNSVSKSLATERQASTTPPAPAIAPLPGPGESFDPDAIMANYLRQRQETLEAVGREDAAPSRLGASAPSPLDQRPVFGRKRA